MRPPVLDTWAIAVGNLPIIVLGLGFKDFIETDARSLYQIIGEADSTWLGTLCCRPLLLAAVMPTS